jgi:hypothetical protein
MAPWDVNQRAGMKVATTKGELTVLSWYDMRFDHTNMACLVALRAHLAGVPAQWMGALNVLIETGGRSGHRAPSAAYVVLHADVGDGPRGSRSPALVAIAESVRGAGPLCPPP